MGIDVKHHRLRYRPHIDGLRAIAVMGVLLFHVGLPVQGGFVGVDVFYVISGFLITKSIVSDLAAGSFSLLGFYERRMRRIFPAMAVVMFAAAVVAVPVLLPTQLVGFVRSLIAAATYTTNFYFNRTAGYFAPDATTLPLLHYWSLAVEEQFYLLFPLSMLLLRRLPPRRLFRVLFAAFAVSLVACEIMSYFKPTAAFYLLPFRAFELLTGSLIALPLDSGRISSNGRIVSAAISLGLMLVVGSMALIDETMRFPGLLALAPCGGAALLLWGGERVHDQACLKLLSWRPLVFIGAISYSLYLVHWPVVVFLNAYELVDGASFALLAIVISFGLGWLSYQYVEKTTRWRDSWISSKKMFVGAVALTAVFIGWGVLVVQLKGFEALLDGPTRRMLSYLKYDYVPEFREGTCFLRPEQTFANVDLKSCVPDGRPLILLWGSSRLAHLHWGLERSLGQSGIAVGQLTASACPAVLGISYSIRPNCRPFNDDALAFILARKPDLVAVEAEPADDMERTIGKLTHAGLKVAVIGTPPIFQRAIPQVLATRLRNGVYSEWSDDKILLHRIFAEDRKLADRFVTRDGVPYISILEPMCPQQRCPLALGDVPLFWDHAHLTREGSDLYSAAIVGQLEAAMASP